MPEPREIPRLLRTDMVQATLAKRKTQTRLPIKLPTWADNLQALYELDQALKNGLPGIALMKDGRPIRRLASPFGAAGDRMYVRETWMVLDNEIFYRAGDPGWDDNCDVSWRPNIHMPKRYARIWLKIKRVWVEEVVKISDADAIAEGIEANSDDGVVYYGPLDKGHADPRVAFGWLWDDIYGKEGLGYHPKQLVWACEFELDHVVANGQRWPE